MDKKLGNILKYIISALVAVVLLYFSFRGVKWEDFWEALRACRWQFVILSMLFGALSFYLRGLRWRELLLPIDPTTTRSTTFNAINICNLSNMVLPRVGEFVRCGYVTANSAKGEPDEKGESTRLASYDKVLGTVALERSWDVLSMMIILVVFVVLGWNRFGKFFSENMLGPALSRLGPGAWWYAIAAVVAVVGFVFVVLKYGQKIKPFTKVGTFLRGIWQGVKSCLEMKSAWKFFVLTAGIWICYWMMSYTIVLSLQGISLDTISPEMAGHLDRISDLNGVDALFLMLAGSVSSMVPVPGGFGAFHYIVALALSTVYGIPFQAGIIFATLSHESQAVAQLVCGGLSYIHETLKKRR